MTLHLQERRRYYLAVQVVFGEPHFAPRLDFAGPGAGEVRSAMYRQGSGGPGGPGGDGHWHGYHENQHLPVRAAGGQVLLYSDAGPRDRNPSPWAPEEPTGQGAAAAHAQQALGRGGLLEVSERTHRRSYDTVKVKFRQDGEEYEGAALAVVRNLFTLGHTEFEDATKSMDITENEVALRTVFNEIKELMSSECG